MVRVSSPAKLRPWSELTAQNGDGGGSCVDEFDPFLQRFCRKSSIWESKVQAFQGELSGRVPPPTVRYVLTPPLPVSELLSGKVQIVSRTLSGLFLVGAVNRPRKRKRTNRENPRRSGVNKSARERIGRQNLSQKVPSKKGSLGVIFSPRNQRQNAHSKSANFEGRHSGGQLLGRPLLFTPEESPRTNREIPGKIGKVPKFKKDKKGQRRTKKEGQVQIGKPPRLNPPRLAALDQFEKPLNRATATVETP